MKSRHTNYRATRKWLAGLMPSARSTWRALQGCWLLSAENSTEQTVEFLSEEGWIPESKQEDPDFHHTCNSISLMAEPYDFHFKDDETEALWGSEKKPKSTWFFSLPNRETNSIPAPYDSQVLSFKLDPSSWPNIISLFPELCCVHLLYCHFEYGISLIPCCQMWLLHVLLQKCFQLNELKTLASIRSSYHVSSCY